MKLKERVMIVTEGPHPASGRRLEWIETHAVRKPLRGDINWGWSTVRRVGLTSQIAAACSSGSRERGARKITIVSSKRP